MMLFQNSLLEISSFVQFQSKNYNLDIYIEEVSNCSILRVNCSTFAIAYCLLKLSVLAPHWLGANSNSIYLKIICVVVVS